MRLSRVWKLYILYSSVLVVCMIAGGFLLQARLQKILRSHLTEDALALGRVIARRLPDKEAPAARVDAFCREYGRAAGVRVTLVDGCGKVLGESERESIGIENHLHRPEIREALESGTGTAVRSSATLGLDMLYAAFPLEGRQGVLRIAIPVKKVEEVESQVMLFLSLGLYAIPLLAMVLSLVLAGWLDAERDQPLRSG